MCDTPCNTERSRWPTPASPSPATAMLTTTTLLTRHVDDCRPIAAVQVQEREGRAHGAQTWGLCLPRTRLSRRSSACYAHGAMRADDSDRMLPDGRPLTHCGSFTMLMTSIRVTLVLAGTAAYLGLAMLGEGGWTAFVAHPALIALAVILFVLAGVSLVAGGNLRRGLREDRGNRWVIGALALLGLLAASLAPYTDRKAFWILDGEPMRWLGVVLFATGGALRIWPVFVLGPRFSGLVAIQPGHTLVTSGVYGVIRPPRYLGWPVH